MANEATDRKVIPYNQTRASEYKALIDGRNEELQEYCSAKAREVRIRHYGHDVYIRGLIEFTNYCRNDCYYCGIRKSNKALSVTALPKSRYLIAAGRDMGLVSGPLCCRAGRWILYG